MSALPGQPTRIDDPTARAQHHIRRIRRDKFGLLDDSAAAMVVNPLAEDLRGSLQQLSEGLYSEDVHFIFELIQNAEDNTYPEGIAPALSFRLLQSDPTNTPGAQGALVLHNNETGFTEQNVDALCAVGRSTKTKQGGYIGEKGIGFKSVFQVSSTPHVFSSGYAFRLPEHEPVTQLGYIVPQWVVEVPDSAKLAGTVLILPLKPGVYECIEQRLREIAAETILFLTQLRSLEIMIEPAYLCRVEKDDSKAPLVRMTSSIYDPRAGLRGSTERKFWVETEAFNRPSNITATKRDGITSREVTIAFPLSERGTIRGSLFAYLPVRKESGLPFLVNADFLVTASREDLKRHEPWNDWLISCLAPTFVSAFEKLLAHPEYRQLAYRYVPATLHIDDERVRRTATRSLEELMMRSVIITENGDLARPSEARRASELLRSAFDPSPRPALLQRLPLVASALEQEYEEKLELLRVPWLSDTEIIQCIQDLSWLGSRPPEWYARFFSFLCRKRESLAGQLSTVPLLLDDKRLCNGATHAVYLAFTQEDRRFLAEVPQGLRTSAYCLHPDVYADLCRDSELLGWASEKLGLQEFKRSKYCSDIAARLSQIHQTCSTELLLAGTRFLALAHDAPTTLPDLPLLLQDGRRTLLSDVGPGRTFQEAAMPFAADPDAGWQQVFDEGDRNHIAALSNAYVEPHADTPSVLRFLAAVGITDAPLPARVQVRKDSSNASAAEKHMLRNLKELSTRDPVITNYRPPTWLRNLADNGDQPARLQKKAEALLNWLEGATLDSRGKPIWANAQLSWFYRIPCDREFESDILRCLKSAAWLPTNKGLCRPQDTFVNSPTIRLILGDTVPVLGAAMPGSLIELLGIRQHASADVLISFLESLSNRNAREPEAVARIYALLANERSSETIEAAFRKHPIILLNTAKGWYTSTEVVWSDRSQSLPDQFGYLERAYPKLREFFTEKLGVKSDVDAQAFANRWLALSAGVETNSEVLENAIAQILSALLPECRRIRGGGSKPDWWDDLTANVRFWCHDGKFRKPDQVFAGDDPEVRKLFEDRVGFVYKPKDQSHARLEDLYRMLGVRYASEALTTRLGNISALHQQQTSRFLTKAAKAQIAAWAYSHRDEYDRLKKDSLLAALLSTEEVNTVTPKIIFSLGGVEVESTKAAYWEANRQRLYLEARRSTDPAIKEEIAETLAKGLMPNRPYRELEDLIYRLLGTNDEQAHILIRKRDWSLPPEAKDLLEKRTSQHPAESIPRLGEMPAPDPPTPAPPTFPPIKPTPVTPAPAPLATFKREVQDALSRPQVEPPATPEPSAPTVMNPARRRDSVTEQIREAISNEPHPSERTTISPRQVWECRDDAVRQFLKEEYGGSCQICLDGFPKRDGQPFFVSKYIVSRTTARTVEHAGNSLCLCPTCAAKFEHGEVLCDNPEQQVLGLKLQREGGQNELVLRLRLCGKDVKIRYSEKHLLNFQQLLQAAAE
jgi:hypothetical protein